MRAIAFPHSQLPKRTTISVALICATSSGSGAGDAAHPLHRPHWRLPTRPRPRRALPPPMGAWSGDRQIDDVLSYLREGQDRIALPVEARHCRAVELGLL